MGNKIYFYAERAAKKGQYNQYPWSNVDVFLYIDSTQLFTGYKWTQSPFWVWSGSQSSTKKGSAHPTARACTTICCERRQKISTLVWFWVRCSLNNKQYDIHRTKTEKIQLELWTLSGFLSPLNPQKTVV